MARRLTIALIGLCLLTPAAASADAFDRVFKEYQSTGKVDACKHSESDLKSAIANIPNDIDAYAPDFRTAVEGALEVRTAGGCDKAAGGSTQQSGTAAPAAPTTTTPPPGTSAAAPPAPGSTVTPSPTPDPTAAAAASDQAIVRTARTAQVSDAGTPAPVVALGVLGALLALGGLVYGLAHWLSWDPRWAQRTRHAVAEAGWRAGNTWSEFADWVRLGR